MKALQPDCLKIRRYEKNVAQKRIEDEFSHCGVDVFTLFKLDGSWKIMSTAYSVEKERCDELIGQK